MLASSTIGSTPDAEAALREYIARRRAQPEFRQRALDPQRARPRAPAPGEPPVRGAHAPVTREALQTISAADIRASRVFTNFPTAPGRAHLPRRSETMLYGRTLSKFIIEEQRRLAEPAPS